MNCETILSGMYFVVPRLDVQKHTTPNAFWLKPITCNFLACTDKNTPRWSVNIGADCRAFESIGNGNPIRSVVSEAKESDVSEIYFFEFDSWNRPPVRVIFKTML